ADELRRNMAAWKRHGGLEHHRERLSTRMLAKQYTPEFIARIFEQIKGFGSYGFPEFHAASFALLSYASSWLKCHEPAAFACALVNSWPMGFYSPDQVLQDARRHGLKVHPVDVRHSDWDCSLEDISEAQPAIRLGLKLVRGLPEDAARRIEQARLRSPFASVDSLAQRAGLDARTLALLADAGALRGLAGHRHRARWPVAAVKPQLPLFGEQSDARGTPLSLPPPSVGEHLLTDYATLGTTLGPHPLALLRPRLHAARYRSSRELASLAHGRSARVAGPVIGRQRPPTAGGVVFVTLEDEFGMMNVVVRQELAGEQRRPLIQSRLMQVDGYLQVGDGNVRHLTAQRLTDLSDWLLGRETKSRDFH